LNPARLLASTT